MPDPIKQQIAVEIRNHIDGKPLHESVDNISQMMKDYADIMLKPDHVPTPWDKFKAWLETYQYGAVTTRELKRMAEQWEK